MAIPTAKKDTAIGLYSLLKNSPVIHIELAEIHMHTAIL